MSTPTNSNVAVPDDSPAQRVAVYVDGLNLYYGLKSRNWRRYYWLDLRRLAENLLLDGQCLKVVRYFTARFKPQTDDPERHVRHDTYLKALGTLPDLTIQYGQHLPKKVTCNHCGAAWTTYEEKMTDVNIAVALMGDAQADVFDTAIVISGDSDLTGPLETVLQNNPKKRIVVAFPPDRVSKRLEKVATGYIKIGKNRIKTSQFPTQVVDANGYPLHKPSRWN